MIMQTKANIILKPLCPKFPIEFYLGHELSFEESCLTSEHRTKCKFCARLPKAIAHALHKAEVDAVVKLQDELRPKVKQMKADGILDQWVVDNNLTLSEIINIEQLFDVSLSIVRIRPASQNAQLQVV
jgi:hypothetical protein